MGINVVFVCFSFCSKHFNKNMDRSRRYYPHDNNMDGFYLAKLVKVAENDVVVPAAPVDE